MQKTAIRLREERSGATRTQERVSHHNDNHPVMEPETRRVRIAAAAEEAANLPGNENAPDLGEFAESYGLKAFA